MINRGLNAAQATGQEETAPRAAERAAGSSKVFMLDEIVVKPGLVAAYRDAYFDQYVPGAINRGMTLEAAWRTPPVDLPEKEATLYFVWSFPNLEAWWIMRVGAERYHGRAENADDGAGKLAWWREAESMTVLRKRALLENYFPARAG
jgi:hypothetical protein